MGWGGGGGEKLEIKLKLSFSWGLAELVKSVQVTAKILLTTKSAGLALKILLLVP